MADNVTTSFRKSPTYAVIVAFMSFFIYAMTSRLSTLLLPTVIVQLTTTNSSMTSYHVSDLHSSNLTESVDHAIGYVLAIGWFCSMLSSLTCGIIIDWFGCKWPMIVGAVFNIVASSGFAFAPNLTALIFLRGLQGFGFNTMYISSLALIGETFQDDTERNQALSRSLIGMAVGRSLSFLLGPLMFEFINLAAPFLASAALCVIDALFKVMLVTKPREKSTQEKKAVVLSLYLTVFKDPYVMLGLMTYFVLNFGLAIYVTLEVRWLVYNLQAEMWQIAIVLLPCMLLMTGGSMLTGQISNDYQWLWFMFGLWTFSLGVIIYPFCTNIWQIFAPEGLIRFGYGICPCSMYAIFARVANSRYSGAVYGKIYGLSTLVMNVGFITGPIFAGYMLPVIKFAWVYTIAGVSVFFVSFAAIIYRNIPNIADKCDKHEYEQFVDSETDAKINN